VNKFLLVFHCNYVSILYPRHLVPCFWDILYISSWSHGLGSFKVTDNGRIW